MKRVWLSILSLISTVENALWNSQVVIDSLILREKGSLNLSQCLPTKKRKTATKGKLAKCQCVKSFRRDIDYI